MWEGRTLSYQGNGRVVAMQCLCKLIIDVVVCKYIQDNSRENVYKNKQQAHSQDIP